MGYDIMDICTHMHLIGVIVSMLDLMSAACTFSKQAISIAQLTQTDWSLLKYYSILSSDYCGDIFRKFQHQVTYKVTLK